ncbi:unnamed protein product, partial [Cladocopium goreaui]
MVLTANDRGPHSCRVHGQLEAWMHFPLAVQLWLPRHLVQELAEQLDHKGDSWQLPFFEADVPSCSKPGPMQHNRDLVLLATRISQGKKRGAGKKRARRRRVRIWRWHSDRTESEKSDAADNADRDGGIAQELVWPEMPFAPPESDYGDGDNETMEHLGQFRDTSVCPSSASGSSSQATPKELELFWNLMNATSVCKVLDEVDSSGEESTSAGSSGSPSSSSSSTDSADVNATNLAAEAMQKEQRVEQPQ